MTLSDGCKATISIFIARLVYVRGYSQNFIEKETAAMVQICILNPIVTTRILNKDGSQIGICMKDTLFEEVAPRILGLKPKYQNDGRPLIAYLELMLDQYVMARSLSDLGDRSERKRF